MKTGISGAVSALTVALVISAAPGWAQEKVGVVTTVVGPVTVARASLPPEPLKFKDDVFVRDRVTTGDAAITRILLGGKVIVTARERSTLTITETPGLSTIHLTGGRIAVAVEKSRMKPGERVDIRTPNAVAGVRGTVLVVETENNVSTVTVLRGLVHVTRLNVATGSPVGPYTAVGARQAVTVHNNVLPSKAKAISSGRVQDLSHEFTAPLKAVAAVAVVHDSDDVKRILAKPDLSVPPGATASGPGSPTPAVSGVVAAPGVVAVPGAVAAPVGVAAPGLAVAPSLVASPTAVATPSMPAVVTAPVSVPTSLRSSISNIGKHASGKYDKDDRSGSNSGRR